jgi:hypothetical protein
VKPEAVQQICDSVKKALEEHTKGLTVLQQSGIFSVRVIFTIHEGGIRTIKKQTSWEELMKG